MTDGAEGSVSGWTRLFLDDDGNPSSMRVMAAIAFVASAYLAVVEVYAEVTKEAGDTELVFYFLAAAFLPKALQKFAEGSTGGPLEEDAERKKGGSPTRTVTPPRSGSWRWAHC